MSDTQAFSQLVKNSHLDGRQRNEAWALFKARGYAEVSHNYAQPHFANWKDVRYHRRLNEKFIAS